MISYIGGGVFGNKVEKMAIIVYNEIRNDY